MSAPEPGSDAAFWESCAGPRGFCPVADLLAALKAAFPAVKRLDRVVQYVVAPASPHIVTKEEWDLFLQRFGPLRLSVDKAVASFFNTDDMSVVPWFHGAVSRATAEAMLRDAAPGHFLVRFSENHKTLFTLVYLKEMPGSSIKRKHCLMYNLGERGFALTEVPRPSDKTYESISSFVRDNPGILTHAVYSALYHDCLRSADREARGEVPGGGGAATGAPASAHLAYEAANDFSGPGGSMNQVEGAGASPYGAADMSGFSSGSGTATARPPAAAGGGMGAYGAVPMDHLMSGGAAPSPYGAADVTAFSGGVGTSGAAAAPSGASLGAYGAVSASSLSGGGLPSGGGVGNYGVADGSSFVGVGGGAALGTGGGGGGGGGMGAYGFADAGALGGGPGGGVGGGGGMGAYGAVDASSFVGGMPSAPSTAPAGHYGVANGADFATASPVASAPPAPGSAAGGGTGGGEGGGRFGNYGVVGSWNSAAGGTAAPGHGGAAAGGSSGGGAPGATGGIYSMAAGASFSSAGGGSGIVRPYELADGSKISESGARGGRAAATKAEVDKVMDEACGAFKRGGLDDAARLFLVTVAKARSAGEGLLEARALANLGLVMKKQSKFREAVDQFRQALPLLDRLDPDRKRIVLKSAADCAEECGDFQGAYDFCAQRRTLVSGDELRLVDTQMDNLKKAISDRSWGAPRA